MYLARPERFELPTTWFEARCSIQLSYERIFLRAQLYLKIVHLSCTSEIQVSTISIVLVVRAIVFVAGPCLFLSRFYLNVRYTSAMDTESKLIALLAGGELCSGTDIGNQLGVSRVTVKKRISSLIKQGLPVTALPGKGYCLKPGADLLSDSLILSMIPAPLREQIEEVEVHQSLASTNQYLGAMTLTKVDRLHAVLAESQSKGKGRRGQGWLTTPYRNLMLSAGWRYGQWPTNPAALSLAFSVAVHKAIVDAGATGALIKWPNDIFLDGAKLAGLLVDAVGEASGECDLVFGVGVNLYLDAKVGKLIDQDWAHLQSVESADMSRNQMAANILANLIEMLSLYKDQGFAPFVRYWNEHAAYMGQAVRLFNDEVEYQGILKGVDETGELILEGIDAKNYRFARADISLRPLEQ